MLRTRKPIPDFSPPPEILNRPLRQASVKDRPLPPTPAPQREEIRSNHTRSSPLYGDNDDYSELGGYRREQVKEDQKRYGLEEPRRHNPANWHSEQFQVYPNRPLDNRPSRHYSGEKFERDHPHNFHHNPPHYKKSLKQEKGYSGDYNDGRRCVNPLSCCCNAVVSFLEEAFYKLGYTVGKHPIITIVIVVVVAVAGGSGIVRIEQENDGTKLWLPADAPSLKDAENANFYFPANTLRINTLLVTAKNILSVASIRAMADIHEKLLNINENDAESNFEAVCLRLGNSCWTRGVLEVWSYDLSVIRQLTQEQILDAVNNITESPVHNIEFNITKYLGKIKRNAQGEITSAGAAQMQYVLRFNKTIIDGFRVDEPSRKWEFGFLKVGEEGHSDLDIYRFAFRSRRDEGLTAITDDLLLLSLGYGIIITFVTIVLGRFNRVEHRLFVSLMGIMGILFALLLSLGLGSYIKLIYGPINSILPFLLLGLGVDDMFVAVSALDNLKKHEKELPVPERIGLALKSAGVSITVTSLTDMLAFGVGISTTLPALRSFCTYCLMGIFFTFIFQCTFFVAWLAVDEYRADAHRDACFCCCRLSSWTPNACSQILFIKSFFRRIWAGFITNTCIKVIVLIMTAGLLAFGIYGTINMEQDSDWNNFLPGDSYARTFLLKNEEYFPGDTETLHSSVFLIDIDHYEKHPVLEKLHTDLEAGPYTEDGTVRSWWYSYRLWLKNSTDEEVIAQTDMDGNPLSEKDFYDLLLNKFLKSREGLVFVQDILLNSTGNGIAASRNTLRQDKLINTEEQVKAMESIRSIVAKTNLTRDQAFPYNRRYLIFEGNKIIQQELYRNLGLAFICVAIMTLFLITNLVTSLFICLCVIMTVVDVGGMMYFWDLKVETVTSIILILAMGLSIDFAAHIGHTFMTTMGSRNERVRRTLILMGPAVFSGGFSTFLAFVLLLFSKSYVFQTFFKVFLGVVIFGLFHGLAFLPVMLSLLGPEPYETAHQDPVGQEDEDRGRAGWYDDIHHTVFDQDRRWPPPDDRRSPARSSLHSSGALYQRDQWASRQGPQDYPSRSQNEDVSRRGYIPRATAFSSRNYSSERDHNSTNSLGSLGAFGNIYGMNMNNGYTKPISYHKPSAYVKPADQSRRHRKWPVPKRHF